MITEAARAVLKRALNNYNDAIAKLTAEIRELETRAAELKLELRETDKNAREIQKTLSDY